ncbi:MAG: STAS domain-containing protein, partial [Pirellulaceae bacterium]|nr:STAS domain-containing protein [Pirellulaceae bacterium]
VQPTIDWIEQHDPRPKKGMSPVANAAPPAPEPDQPKKLVSESATPGTDPLDWLESRSQQGVLVLKFLVGRLDSKKHRKEDYHRVLTDAIAAGHNRVVLNFSKLGYTNHTWGIFQLIFTASNLLKQAGGSLSVCGTKGHVHRVYTFANLDRFAPGYRRESQAVEALSPGPDTC